jgi:hypothetical protein
MQRRGRERKKKRDSQGRESRVKVIALPGSQERSRSANHH